MLAVFATQERPVSAKGRCILNSVPREACTELEAARSYFHKLKTTIRAGDCALEEAWGPTSENGERIAHLIYEAQTD
jgi:hypothetical protein